MRTNQNQVKINFGEQNNILENIRGRKCIFKVLRVYYQGINGTLKLYMTRTRDVFYMQDEFK